MGDRGWNDLAAGGAGLRMSSEHGKLSDRSVGGVRLFVVDRHAIDFRLPPPPPNDRTTDRPSPAHRPRKSPTGPHHPSSRPPPCRPIDRRHLVCTRIPK